MEIMVDKGVVKYGNKSDFSLMTEVHLAIHCHFHDAG